MKLRNYTLRYLSLTLLVIIPLWASLFYVVMMEEVYDNIDDGLKNQKILIIRQAYANKELLDTESFGITRFTIKRLPKGNYSHRDKITTAKEFMEYDNDYQPIRILTNIFNDAEGNPYKLEIRTSMVEEDELLEDLALSLAGLYIMLFISIFIVNNIILKRIWKGFYSTLENLKNFRLGSGMAFKPSDTKIDEFRVLDTELTDMLARNEKIYSSQKQFIENASHELQTPLAISLNKLELLAESNNLPEDQMAELDKISDTLNRLVRLNKSLLMLSKIENRQFADEENINLNDLVQQLTEDYYDLAEYKEISITVDTLSPLNFTMNRGLAITLVSNLIKNAIIHNHKGGSIQISIKHDSIAISNTGNPKALDTDYIYRRFYRNSHNEHSTGLGLSIVSSIVSNYKLAVTYTFNGQHNFIINFPKK